MRLNAPPSQVVGQIRLDAIVRAGWAFAAISLAISAAITIDHFSEAGAVARLPLPLIATAVFGITLLGYTLRPHWSTRVLCLAVGMATVGVIYDSQQLAGIIAPDRSAVGGVLVALCLLGTIVGRERAIVAWDTVGFVAGQGAFVLAQLAHGMPPRLNVMAVVVYALMMLICLTAHRSLRARMRLDGGPAAEPVTLGAEPAEPARDAALAHDTILRDLALIAHGPLSLDIDDRSRLRRNLADVAGARARGRYGVGEGLPATDFYALVREFQWGGLTVDVGGSSADLELLAPPQRAAMLEALRGALENVQQHSGEDQAEVFIDHSAQRLTVMVVDEGCGFDPEAAPNSTAGGPLSGIVRCVEEQGGRATVWSAPDAGTSVILSFMFDPAAVTGEAVPAAAAVSRQPPQERSDADARH